MFKNSLPRDFFIVKVMLGFLCVLIVWPTLTRAFQSHDSQSTVCEIEFVVLCLPNLPKEKNVFLAGSLDSLGPWRPDGLKLSRVENSNEWRGQLVGKKGDEISFKFTCGNWGSVEKGSHGEEIANRTLKLVEDTTIELTIDGWSSDALERVTTATGDIQVISVPEILTGSMRRISVWIPPIYKESTERLPVLYLLDGQNIFDASRSAMGVEWQADEIAAQLILKGQIEPILIVAIDNSLRRIAEYTRNKGDDNLEHLQWIIDVLKPRVDQEFRTRTEPQYTTIGGSSLGGLLALDAFQSQDQVFGNALCMSPSLFWDEERLLKQIEMGRVDLKGKNRRLWIDFGTHESTDPLKSSEHLARFSRLRKGIESFSSSDGIVVSAKEFVGAAHNEEAWTSRLPEALTFLFGR